MNKPLAYFIISALFLMLIAFLALHFFSWPAADDFFLDYKSGVSLQSTGRELLELYQTWGGRFSSLLFALPQTYQVNNIVLYRLTTLLIMVLLLLSIYVFFRVILAKGIPPYQTIMFSLAFLLIYLNVIPATADTFYWLSGTVVYTLPLVFFLILNTLLLKQPKSKTIKTWHKIGIAISAFLLVGFNELSMLLAIVLAGAYAFHHVIVGQRIATKTWVMIIAVLAGSTLFVLSPGNTERMIFFPGGQNILSMLKIGSASLVKLNGIFLQSILLLLTAFLVFPWLDSKYFSTRLGDMLQLHPLAVIIPGQILMLLLFCLPAWAMGINPPLRIYNFVSLLWLLWFFWSLSTLQNYFKRKRIKTYSPVKGRSLVVLIIIVILSALGDFHKIPGEKLVFRGNIPRAWYDMCVNAQPYNKAMKERKDLIAIGKDKDISIIKVPVLDKTPGTIFFIDITDDHKHWINKLHANHYGIKYIVKE